MDSMGAFAKMDSVGAFAKMDSMGAFAKVDSVGAASFFDFWVLLLVACCMAGKVYSR